MPVFKRPDAEIYYEVYGSGHPLLLFAAGGLRSRLAFWRHSPSNPDAPAPWMNPMVDLADRFTVIGMDQRNAGDSRGRVTAADSWHTFAGDHLALMDHLGYQRFHVMGGCIGSSYCLSLCEMAPDRITAAVLQNPIGFHENRATWDEMVSTFSKTMLERDPTLTADVIQKFGHNMFGGDFVFSVSREFVSRCRTPLLLQPGSDTPHPAATSAEIARLAPHLEIQKDWRGPENRAEAIRRVTEFLVRHTPASAGTAGGAGEAELLQADDRRFEAMRRGDWTALDAALADDLVYVHSTARLESKGEHIANLRAGKPHYRGIAPRERRARVRGDVGLVNGVSEMHVERDGKEQRFTVRYLAVYVKTGGQWRMISWQSTKVPEA
jgi:pimeloyl-ACP methyl ester carboxylesterase